MQEINNNNDESISISLSSLSEILKKELKLILLVTLLFLFAGILYTLNTPKEYVSVSKIMPEVSYKASNGMGGLYELLKKYNSNVDLYNTEITRSELYEEILKTNEFYDYILAKKVETIDNKKITFKAYYDSNLESKSNIFQREKTDSIKNLRIKKYAYGQTIQKKIVITIKKNNLILVSVKMPDPVVAADIANFTISYLIDYISKYRTEKARQELHFIENLLQNVPKNSTKDEDFTKEIQHSLLTSIVQMKIKIQEDTPIFQVLEKAQIPVASNDPSTFTILIEFIFIGFLIGVFVAFLRNNNYRTLFK
jgi:uncharacterized protein involved in exopolysaccharide biosynthesis